jgi:hypothetical protein
MTKEAIHELSAGSIRVWAEPGGPIMIKAVEPSGDPVEINEHEADELVKILNGLIADIS